MPRLTSEKLEELHFSYVDAAINIVISSGWGELSIRRLAKEVGKAAATLHEHFTSEDRLRQTLVAIAFGFTDRLQSVGQVPLSPIQEATLLLNLAKVDAQEARLMNQVTANAAIPASPLHQLYREQHGAAILRLAEFMTGEGFGTPAQRVRRARRMVNRYIGLCAMLVADPEMTVMDSAAALT